MALQKHIQGRNLHRTYAKIDYERAFKDQRGTEPAGQLMTKAQSRTKTTQNQRGS